MVRSIPIGQEDTRTNNEQTVFMPHTHMNMMSICCFLNPHINGCAIHIRGKETQREGEKDVLFFCLVYMNVDRKNNTINCKKVCNISWIILMKKKVKCKKPPNIVFCNLWSTNTIISFLIGNWIPLPGCSHILFLSNGLNASRSMLAFSSHFISIKSLDKNSQGPSNAACFYNNGLQGM